MAANPTVQARMEPREVADLDRTVKGKVNEDGSAKLRSDGVREAVLAYIAAEDAGAFYATDRERKLVTGLRVLRRTHGEAANAVMEIAERALEDPSAADALASLLATLRGLAPRGEATRPAEAHPRKKGNQKRGGADG